MPDNIILRTEGLTKRYGGVHALEGADFDLRARPPNEISAEDFGMQRPDKDADAPKRQAGRQQAFACLRHQERWRDRSAAIDQPVGSLLQFG